MKRGIKVDSYVLKEYFIATLYEKNIGEGLSKSIEMVVKMPKVRSPKSKINTGYDHLHFSIKDCLASLAHRADKCYDFGFWNVVPFLN